MRFVDLASLVSNKLSSTLGASICMVLFAPAAFAQATRVNAPVVAGGTVNQYQVSADGSRVFYAASQTTPGTIEIHDVPLDGSQATRALSAPLVAGESCYFLDPFRVSPDEGHLLYLADQDTDNQLELYSIPTDGTRVSTKLNLSGPSVAPGYQWTPDGTRVVFRVGGSSLYSVPAGGSQPAVHLNPGKNSDRWEITPDSRRVVFLSNLLYTVPIDGSSPAQPLDTPHISFVESFEMAAGGVVVYQGVRWTSYGTEDGREDAVYTIPADGSSPGVRILGPFVNYSWEYCFFELTPDTTHVLFESFLSDALYSARVDGQGAARLSPSSFPNYVQYFRPSSDGDSVVFQLNNAGQSGLFISPTDGSTAPILLVGPGSGNLPAEIGADRVVFSTTIAGNSEICSIPRDGSEPFVVLTDSVVGRGFWGYSPLDLISPDGRSVTYSDDRDTAGVIELYVVPIDGGRLSRKLNSPLVAGGDVQSSVYVQGTDFVLYLADQDTDGANELFMSRYKGFVPHAAPTSRTPAPTAIERP